MKAESWRRLGVSKQVGIYQQLKSKLCLVHSLMIDYSWKEGSKEGSSSFSQTLDFELALWERTTNERRRYERRERVNLLITRHVPFWPSEPRHLLRSTISVRAISLSISLSSVLAYKQSWIATAITNRHKTYNSWAELFIFPSIRRHMPACTYL